MATKVLRIITRLNIGGPSIQALTLTDRLGALGFETTLVHGRLGEGEGDMRYLVEGRNLDLVYLPTLRRAVSPVHDARALWAIFRTLRNTRPVVLHTHMAKAGTLGRVAALAHNLMSRRAARVRVVHTYHGHVLEGYFGRWRTRAFIEIERWLARATDRIIAISPRIREELLSAYRIGDRDQYAVVPLGFDLEPFRRIGPADRLEARRRLGIADARPVITTAGRLTAIKQHGLFLEMARRVVEVRRDATFLIAGDGEERAALERAAARAGLEPHVRFLGWWRDLPVLYAASDVFVLTSRNEGTPVALIEAMAAGVPGVATDVGGVSDVIDQPSIGVLVPSGHAEALALAVMRLVEHADERAAIGERARASVLSRYGLDRLVADIASVYVGLAGQQAPSARPIS